MKKFFALALLSSLTFQTRAVDLQDLGNLVVLPGVLAVAAAQFEKDDTTGNFLEKAAEGSAYASGTRAICFVEGNGLDTNFKDLSVDSALYTGLLYAEDYLKVEDRLKTARRSIDPKMYSALKLAVYAAAVNAIRAGLAQLPIVSTLVAVADEVKAVAPVVASKVQTAASVVATAAVQKK